MDDLEISPGAGIDWEALEEQWDDQLEADEDTGLINRRQRRLLRRVLRHKLGALGGFVLVVLVIVAVFAPVIAPYSVDGQDLLHAREAPSSAHVLGTDGLGRDIFSRIIFGTRETFLIAITAVGFAFSVGTVLGSLAGYYGGRVDSIVQTGIDLTWSFPSILVGLALAAFLSPNLGTVLVAIGIVFWGLFARLIRGEVLSLREEEYIKAAKAVGMNHRRILFRHILPNAIVPAFVVATLQMGNAIAVEASLSFLGLGAQPPTPSWGLMLSSGREYLRSAWWIATFPGIAIVIVILAFNLLGDGLRDALDPKLKY